MKKQWKGFVFGFVTAVLCLGLGGNAVGAALNKTIQVFTGVNIYIDDVKLNPTDANGNPVDVFLFNGTTYLPVRAVSEALGQVVQWEGKTSSVYIGKHAGEKPAVWVKDLDYFTGGAWKVVELKKDNLGNEHYNVIRGYDATSWGSASGVSNTYRLNAQYSKITGTLFQDYDKRSDSGVTTLTIYGDGELLYKAEMFGGKDPIDFSVDLSGVLEMKISLSTTTGGGIWGHCNASIADCGLWT